jgi:hypothetical protein
MTLLPRISMSDLQRRGKQALQGVREYAVIQRHGEDVAFVLHPDLGRVLVESGMLDALQKKLAQKVAGKPVTPETPDAPKDALPELDRLIGQVLRELSSR